MSLNLFGTPQIRRGNEQISIQRRKDLALLVYLASSARPHSRDTLAALLWQEESQPHARANLRKSVSRLKSSLGDNVLLISYNEISLNSQIPIKLDTAQFTSLIDQFRQHGHIKSTSGSYLCEQCQAALLNAARLYCADFLQGFSIPDSPAFDEWQFFQSETLRKSLAEALESLTLQFTVMEKYDQALEHCQRWSSLDRLNEPPHRQLMLLYALSGQQAAALRQFDEYARLIKSELDAVPEPETLQLYEAIKKRKIHEIFTASESARSTDRSQRSESSGQRVIHNLPVHRGSFVGREKELQELLRILQDPSCRLLTLIGPGGSGKTRLASQAALVINTHPAFHFNDGVEFIPAAHVTDPDALINAMIEGLRLTAHIKGADAREKLLSHLRGRHMLLVIDNFEQLIGEASIELVSAMLDATPSSRIMITSRERLNLQSEYIFRVDGLEIPADTSLPSAPNTDPVLPAFSALQLFEQSALRIQPSFQITQENYVPLAQICRTVQGMPLAIELAASWLEVFSVEEINAEIQRSLDFLHSNWRDLPDRQRSLRAVFASSWALLEKQTRPVVKALSVFRTSFTREAAQAVSGASAKALLELTNKSWLQRLSNGRYQIHELLRQFVYEKLADEELIHRQVIQQYCDYYSAYTQSLWNVMQGADQAKAFTGIESEFENIHAAWMWLVSGSMAEVAVHRMLPMLFHYTELRGKTHELLNMLDEAIKYLGNSSGDERLRTARIIALTAHSAIYEDGYPLRYSLYDALFPVNDANIKQAWNQINTVNNLPALGFWGVFFAYIYGRLINVTEGTRQLKKLAAHFKKTDQSWNLAITYLHALKLMVPNAKSAEHQANALSSYLSEAMNIFDTLGDRINKAQILNLWGDLQYRQQNMAGAIEQWKSAQEVLLSVNEWGSATMVFWQLIEAYLQLGDFQKAYKCCEEMVKIYTEHGMREFVVGALSKESYEKARHGDLTEALHIRQKCIDIIHETGPEYQMAWNYWEMGEVLRLMGNLPEAATWFERSHPIFAKFEDNIGLSFYRRGLGDIALAGKDFETARFHFTESVRLSRASRHAWMIAYTLNGLSRTELRLEHAAVAERHIRQALKIARQTNDQCVILTVLCTYAEILNEKGQPEKAVPIALSIKDHVLTWNETRQQAMTLLYILKKSLSPANFSRAAKAGKADNLWTMVQKLAKP